MTSISSQSRVSGSATEQLLRLREPMQSSGVRKGPEEALHAMLEKSDLSAEDQASLKSELQAAFQSAFESGGRPDPAAMHKQVGEIFAKYGLDAEALASEAGLPAGGPPSGGMCGCGPKASGYDSSTTGTLLDLLNQGLESASSEDEDSDATTSAARISEFVYRSLMRFDELA